MGIYVFHWNVEIIIIQNKCVVLVFEKCIVAENLIIIYSFPQY